MVADAHMTVEDDNAFKRGTEGKHPMSLVILVLLAHKEDAHLGIIDHKLYLLFTAGGIEGYGDSTYAPGTKIYIKILGGVL